MVVQQVVHLQQRPPLEQANQTIPTTWAMSLRASGKMGCVDASRMVCWILCSVCHFGVFNVSAAESLSYF
jgi:hypothetical protein